MNEAIDTVREVARSLRAAGPKQALGRLIRSRQRMRPELEDYVERERLPLAYRELSAPQWNALLRHEPKACRAPIVVAHGKRRTLVARDPLAGFSKLSMTRARRWKLDASEQDTVASSAHEELVTLLESLTLD
jgi:hypothetical protein